MIASQRSHTRSPPPISNQMSAELLHRPRSNMPTSFSKGHKPSLSKSMAWLGRGSTQYAPPKPLQISEPKFVNEFEVLQTPRSGALGSGAIVVKTPQDALSGQFYEEEEEYEVHSDHPEVEMPERKKSPSAPKSADLPAIPVEQNISDPPVVDPAAPTTSDAPPTPAASTAAIQRPSLKSRSSGHSVYLSSVPRSLVNITAAPVIPPFEPILVDALPTGAIDPSKIIVALETGTSTHRTTWTTLTSRISRLSTYLTSLLPQPEEDTTSAYSPTSAVSSSDSTFNSIFHQHLASSGLLPQASSSIHVFLDRPSAPYTHIMAYLRTTPSTPECPAMLPRAIQLISTSSSRLEALLELRDEANYLDLQELYQLCNAEICHRESLLSQTRVGSTGSMLHSPHTFRERPSSEPHPAEQPADDPRRDSIVTHRSAPKERDSVATRSAENIVQPPTARPSHARSQSHGRPDRTAPLRSPPLPPPPPGWI